MQAIPYCPRPRSLPAWLRTIVVCLTTVLFVPTAHAVGLPVLINLGTEMFDVESTSVPNESDHAAKALRIGYLCNHVGLFWADIWTWNCRLVQVVSDEAYAELPGALGLALARDPRFAFENAKRGLWNHYAFWTPFYVLGALCGIVLVLVLVRVLVRLVQQMLGRA